MKVKELTAWLKKYDDDVEVIFWDTGRWKVLNDKEIRLTTIMNGDMVRRPCIDVVDRDSFHPRQDIIQG